jgi:hypothetical protein
MEAIRKSRNVQVLLRSLIQDYPLRPGSITKFLTSKDCRSTFWFEDYNPMCVREAEDSVTAKYLMKGSDVCVAEFALRGVANPRSDSGKSSKAGIVAKEFVARSTRTSRTAHQETIEKSVYIRCVLGSNKKCEETTLGGLVLIKQSDSPCPHQFRILAEQPRVSYGAEAAAFSEVSSKKILAQCVYSPWWKRVSTGLRDETTLEAKNWWEALSEQVPRGKRKPPVNIAHLNE